MPIISSKPAIELEKMKLKVSADLLAEIKEYCEAFKVENLDDFFCQAIQYVLKTDRDWAKVNKQKTDEKNL